MYMHMYMVAINAAIAIKYVAMYLFTKDCVCTCNSIHNSFIDNTVSFLALRTANSFVTAPMFLLTLSVTVLC